jgi:hypothetical protein
MSSSNDESSSSDKSVVRNDSTSRKAAASAVTLVQPPSSNGGSIRSKRRNRLKNNSNNKQGKNSDTSQSSKSAKAATRDNGYYASSSNGDDDVYLPTSGNLPDPWHGAISMEHLRQHAQFHPLPPPPLNPPPALTQLSSLEDVRQFRQDSWQWHVLHQGRCTTSMAAAALGFLEPTAGQVLGIPPSWRRGAGKAFFRLRQPAIRTLEEINALLLNPPADIDDNHNDKNADPISSTEESVWQAPSTSRSSSTSSSSSTNNTPTTEASSSPEAAAPKDEQQSLLFVADYVHQPSSNEMQRRKAYMRERSSPEYLTKAIRLYWGNTQEATAMLTALNYFSKNSSTNGNVTLVEVGMCGAGLDLNQSSSSSSSSSSLLVGATPDGVLCYSDGRIEALEVKNHCPFFSNAGRKRRGGKVRGSFSIGDRPMDQTGILAQYVSQMQLEMLCLGAKCQSAVMVRQTATQGAYIIRMHRDDDWIQEMLYFLHLFQRDYVEQNIKPPTDFFWHGQEDIAITKRYRRFVNRTAQLKGHIVAYIPHNEIQRVNGPSPFFLDHV